MHFGPKVQLVSYTVTQITIEINGLIEDGRSLMSKGKTISEKILSTKSGLDAHAGDLVVCDVDYAMGTDASVPMAIDYFRQMGGEALFDPGRIVIAADHYAPPPNEKAADLLQIVRDFAEETGAVLYDAGEGIGHQLMVEKGYCSPGGLVVAADSHAVTYGALNCFATGIGSSDLAAAMISGKVWLRVPDTIKIMLTGELPPEVFAKDVALALCGQLGADGAAYKTMEFCGSAVQSLDMDDRLVIANMVVEMGAKNGFFPVDQVTRDYLQGRSRNEWDPFVSDVDATYCDQFELDLEILTPQVAEPHLVDNVTDIDHVSGQPVDLVYLGTCTGGRASDLRIARDIIKASNGPADSIKLVVTPASEDVRQDLEADGTLADFIEMGATIQTPGCGSCCGTCGVKIADETRVISTANRNFKGRMGNPSASIWLASPAACAATALTGRITAPKRQA